MRRFDLLTVTSLLTIVLMTLHLTDDIVRGFEPNGIEFGTIAIPVLWLVAALLLAGQRSGYAVLALGSLFAAVMPVVHMSGKGVGRIAATEGGFFFIWTLVALGVLGTFSLILSVRGFWRVRRGFVEET